MLNLFFGYRIKKSFNKAKWCKNVVYCQLWFNYNTVSTTVNQTNTVHLYYFALFSVFSMEKQRTKDIFMAGFPRCRKKLMYSLSDEIMCINVTQVSKLCGFHIFKCLENKLKYVTAVLNILLLIIDIFFLYILCYFKYHTDLSVSFDLYIAFKYGYIHFGYIYRLTFKHKSTRSTFLLELCLHLTRRNEETRHWDACIGR